MRVERAVYSVPPASQSQDRPVKSVLPLKIVVPLLLGIIAALAIGVYSELGYRRLESANRQMAVALQMQASLHQALLLVTDAETGERGYLLTGKEEYLEPYRAAIPKIDTEFSRLRELLVVNGTAAQRDSVGRMNSLVGKKLGELESTIELYRKSGPENAHALTDTGVGKRTMDEIRAEVDDISATHRNQVDDASGRWAKDIEFARAGMLMVTTLTVALLLVVWYLARRDADQREARRVGMQQDKQRLETLVEERTTELSELSNHLQVVREDEKTKLARDLHDELGGILVSAKMDVAWVEERIAKRDAEAAAKLSRALQALDESVQIKRRITEDLRPTLLDNLGLSAAVDWQVHEVCNRAGLKCKMTLPSDDSSIAPAASIALYRIMQEALTNIVKYSQAKNVTVALGVGENAVTLVVDDDGIGIPDGAQNNFLSHGITGMRQRVRALRGEFSITKRSQGGTRVKVGIPVRDAKADRNKAAPDPLPREAAAD
jgi:signal transduction histidine kinase